MTIEQMQQNEEAARKEWEAKTKVGNFTIAEMREVTDKIFNPQNWKASWAADVPHQIVSLVLEAVEFFHADKAEVHGIVPLSGKVRMSGRGYQG